MSAVLWPELFPRLFPGLFRHRGLPEALSSFFEIHFGLDTKHPRIISAKRWPRYIYIYIYIYIHIYVYLSIYLSIYLSLSSLSLYIYIYIHTCCQTYFGAAQASTPHPSNNYNKTKSLTNNKRDSTPHPSRFPGERGRRVS